MATLFENEHSVLENASMMVDVCRQEYARAGMDEEASKLFGLEVTDASSAHLALMTVLTLPIEEGLIDVRRCTLDVLKSARSTLGGPKSIPVLAANL